MYLYGKIDMNHCPNKYCAQDIQIFEYIRHTMTHTADSQLAVLSETGSGGADCLYSRGSCPETTCCCCSSSYFGFYLIPYTAGTSRAVNTQNFVQLATCHISEWISAIAQHG